MKILVLLLDKIVRNTPYVKVQIQTLILKKIFLILRTLWYETHLFVDMLCYLYYPNAEYLHGMNYN